MNRLAATLFAIGLLWPSWSHAEDPKPKNVLFLLVDDLRPELGCYGNSQIKTPNIDALARVGVKFDRAYCQYPLCNPSRTSLLNGRHPRSTGVFDNNLYFRGEHPDFVTLPQYFTAHGYPALRTGKVFHGTIDDTGSWTEGGTPRAFEGFVRPAPERPAGSSDQIVVLEGDGESHNDYKTASKGIEYLGRFKDRPFFLAVGFTKPHSPPTAPRRFFDLYDPATIPLPPDFAPRPTVPEGYPKRSVPARNGDLFVNRDASPEAAREMIRAYWAATSWTDWNVGRVLAELDRLGLRDNTTIVFWGDHGYHLGEKGKWSKHQSLFEIGTHVPLIIAAPGARGNGRTSPRVVQSIDIYPTLAELSGLPKPPGVEGLSLVPLLQDPEAAWDHPAYTAAGTAKAPAVAVRTERWRYIEWDRGQSGALLFDHDNDPHETKNLIDDPRFAEVRDRLSALARKHAPAEVEVSTTSKPSK
ncbi:sulfatase [Singulisphaera sp. PoT]|uniref:sulfatase n=1 Tax=Singulisphaera sp. PoT TaxID=3411797 RepID=UPI003BF55B90